MKNLVLLILSVLVFSCLSSAQIETKNYDLEDFTKVSAATAINLIIKQSDKFSVEAKAEKEAYQYLIVEKSGGELKIRLKKNGHRLNLDEPIIFRINMPSLEAVELSGACYANVEMNLPKKDFDADLSGGSELEGKVKYADMKIELSGGCKATLSGTANDLTLDGSGGTSYDFKDLKANNIDVDLSGAAKASVYLTGKLNADLSGACKIKYYGNPTSVSSHTSGFSSVSKGD